MLEGLKEKVGPFPVYVWGVMGAIGFGAYLFVIRAPTRTTTAPGDSNVFDSKTPGVVTTTPSPPLPYTPGFPSTEPTPDPNAIGLGYWLSRIPAQAQEQWQGNLSYADDFDRTLGNFLKSFGPDEIPAGDWANLHGDYAYARDTISSRVERQVAYLEAQAVEQSKFMNANDAATLWQRTREQTSYLRGQYAATNQRWLDQLEHLHRAPVHA